VTVSDAQIAHIHDLFADLGPINTRKMFGGLGIYCGGTIFALLMSDGSLRLKGAKDMAQAYEAEGWRQWTYLRKDGNAAAMPYWHMPEEMLEDPDTACDWARRALAAL
jgi:DNA transformation protein